MLRSAKQSNPDLTFFEKQTLTAISLWANLSVGNEN